MSGTNRLIKEGANMFETIDDVLVEMPNLQKRFGFVEKLSEPNFAEFSGPEIKVPVDEVAKVKRNFRKIKFFNN